MNFNIEDEDKVISEIHEIQRRFNDCGYTFNHLNELNMKPEDHREVEKLFVQLNKFSAETRGNSVEELTQNLNNWKIVFNQLKPIFDKYDKK